MTRRAALATTLTGKREHLRRFIYANHITTPFYLRLMVRYEFTPSRIKASAVTRHERINDYNNFSRKQ